MFGTEGEMCEAFMQVARADYAVHAECSNWDILVVERATGRQLGIEAKLRPSSEVIAQALPWARHDPAKEPGPDLRAVLVPVANHSFLTIATMLNLWVFSGGLLNAGSVREAFRLAPVWPYKERCWIPECEVIAPAGVPSPRRTTRWKLHAVKLCLRARANGFVTPADMKELKLDRNWWFHPRAPILISVERGKYILNPDAETPDKRWPEIVEALTREAVAVKPVFRGRVRKRAV